MFDALFTTPRKNQNCAKKSIKIDKQRIIKILQLTCRVSHNIPLDARIHLSSHACNPTRVRDDVPSFHPQGRQTAM